LKFALCHLPFDLPFRISKFKWQKSNGKRFAEVRGFAFDYGTIIT